MFDLWLLTQTYGSLKYVDFQVQHDDKEAELGIPYVLSCGSF